MKGIFHALTTTYRVGHSLHGGHQWKCASPALEDGTFTNHLVAYLAGDADTIYSVGNHRPLKPSHIGIRYPGPTAEEYQSHPLMIAYEERKNKAWPDLEAAHAKYAEAHHIAHLAYSDACEAEYDAGVIIPENQAQLSPTNLVCFCGQKVQL